MNLVPKQRSSTSMRGLSVVFASVGLIALSGADSSNGAENEWSRAKAAAAADELTSIALDNCEYEFDARRAIKSVTQDNTATGRYGFYRCGDTIIVDFQLKSQNPNDPDIPSKQFIKRPSHPFLELYYSNRERSPSASKLQSDPNKQFKFAVGNDRSEPAELFTNHLNRIQLGHVLGKFASTDLSLRQIAEQSVPNALVSPNGQEIVGSFQSRYGSISVTVSLVYGRFRITSIALRQSAADILHRAADMPLRAVTDGFNLPPDPNGLASGAVTIHIAYSTQSNGGLFVKEYSVFEEFSNSRGSFKRDERLECTRYSKQNSAANLEKFAIGIPNGREIYGLSGWPIRRMWSDGHVVRHSDDTALKIASTLVQSRRFWFVLSPLAVLAACGIYGIVRWRRCRRSQRSPAR